jgi:predicted MPP superfamily phosphohydrolase
MRSIQEIDDFDRKHEEALRKIWFCGDPHNHFDHVDRLLTQAASDGHPPNWLVFLGDLDLEGQSMRDVIERLRRLRPAVKVAFIHGNHDADSHKKWALLYDCGDAVALHGQVVDLDGILVAGLGGNFLGRVWAPPGEVLIESREKAMGGPNPRRKPNPKLHGAIYPDEYRRLAEKRADVLVTHEAPSCHHHGWAVLDKLARSLRVYRSFHGHTHDDLSRHYETKRLQLGFDARAVDGCCVKNALGEKVC